MLTWNDVKHLCYPGSSVDIPCWHPVKKIFSYVAYEEIEDAETYLHLTNGDIINARDFQTPLGWELPK